MKKIIISCVISIGMFQYLYSSSVTSSIKGIDAACTQGYQKIQQAKTNYGNLSITLGQYEGQVREIGLELYLNLQPLVAKRIIPMQPVITSNPINKIPKGKSIANLLLFIYFKTNKNSNSVWNMPITIPANEVAAINAALATEQVSVSIALRTDQENNTIVCWTAYGLSSQTMITTGDDYLLYRTDNTVVPKSAAPIMIVSNFQASFVANGPMKQLAASPSMGNATVFAME